jgi:hypothetical protein
MERGYKREQSSTCTFRRYKYADDRKDSMAKTCSGSIIYIHFHPPPPHTYTHSHTYARSARPAHFHHTPTTRHGTPRHNDRNRTPDAARKPPLQTAHETWRKPHPYREFQASACFESVKTHITRARVYPLSALRKRRHTNTAQTTNTVSQAAHLPSSSSK